MKKGALWIERCQPKFLWSALTSQRFSANPFSSNPAVSPAPGESGNKLPHSKVLILTCQIARLTELRIQRSMKLAVLVGFAPGTRLVS